MGLIIGPTPWWQKTIVAVCPVGTTLPDGSKIICKAGGTAWIVAPSSTQVGQGWNSTSNTQVGNKPCVCDWPILCARMISCGFNPADWFVPCIGQLNNPGYICRTQWDFASTVYWSSTDLVATVACVQYFNTGNLGSRSKLSAFCVRAFRCVTYF